MNVLIEKLGNLEMDDGQPSNADTLLSRKNVVNKYPIEPKAEKALKVMQMMNERGSKLPESNSIMQCLKTFTAVEYLHDENKFACEQCYKLLYHHDDDEPFDKQIRQSLSMDHDDEHLETNCEQLHENSSLIVGGSLNILEEHLQSDLTSSTASSATVVGNTDDEIFEEEIERHASLSSHDLPASTLDTCDQSKNKKSAPSKAVLRNARKRFLIEEAPRILVLQLKRFHQTGRRGRLEKTDTLVQFMETIDISDYCTHFEQPKTYQLFAVVEHAGSLHGGHYVAYVKSASLSSQDDDHWVYCSDANVKNISLDDVLQCQAYILFYQQME